MFYLLGVCNQKKENYFNSIIKAKIEFTVSNIKSISIGFRVNKENEQIENKYFYLIEEKKKERTKERKKKKKIKQLHANDQAEIIHFMAAFENRFLVHYTEK